MRRYRASSLHPAFTEQGWEHLQFRWRRYSHRPLEYGFKLHPNTSAGSCVHTNTCYPSLKLNREALGETEEELAGHRLLARKTRRCRCVLSRQMRLKSRVFKNKSDLEAISSRACLLADDRYVIGHFAPPGQRLSIDRCPFPGPIVGKSSLNLRCRQIQNLSASLGEPPEAPPDVPSIGFS